MVTSQDISHSPKIRRGQAGWGPLAVGVAVGAYCLALRRYGFELADEGTLLAQIDRVVHGQTPYRDFHTGYGPGLFYANAGLLAALGASVATVRWGLVLVHGLRATLLGWLAGRVGPSGWTAVSAIALVAFFLPVAPGVCIPFFVPYAAWYADALGLVAIWLLTRPPHRGRSLGVGMLWGAAFVFKQNTGLVGVGAAAIGSVLASRDEGESGAHRALVTSLGIALVAGGVALLHAHLDLTLVAVMLGPLAVLAIAVARVRPGSRALGDLLALGLGFALVAMPIVATMAYVAGAAAVAGDLLQIGTDTALVYHVPYPAPAAIGDALLGSGGVLRAMRQVADLSWFAVLPLVHLAVALLILRGKVTSRAGLVVGAAAVVGYLQLYPRMDGWHLLSLAPSSLAALGLVLATCGRPLRRALTGVLLAASLGRMLPVLPVMGALATTPPELPAVERLDLRWDLLVPEHLRRLPEVVAAVRGQASVMGFPALGAVSFALGTPSPFRHDYFFPGRPTAAEEAPLVDALRTRPPAAVVVLDAPIAFFPAAFASHPQIVAALAERFVTAREIGSYRILVPRGRP